MASFRMTFVVLALAGLLTCPSLAAVHRSGATWLAPRGQCRHCGQWRAGCPDDVAWYARFSNGCDYGGYYIGGGGLVFGEPRCGKDGTWGWDYFGKKFRRRVDLEWLHGIRTLKDREGSYETD